MTEQQSTVTRWTQLRRWLRRVDPVRLGFLGLLSLPGYLFESLAVLKIFALFYILFLWMLVGPIVDIVLRRGAEESTEPTDWLEIGTAREYAVSYGMLPLTFANPLLLIQDSFQLAGSAVAAVRHRGSLPARGDEREVEYRLPVDGEWTVVNGSLDREFSHSWFPANQRYAYDFVITDDEGRTRPEGASHAVEQYYCHDEPILAPADGVVVDVFDTDLEPGRGGGFSHPLKRDIRGNYVTIQHAPGEYSCLAHLVPGSVAVEPGEEVTRGQEVGRCGHTGNSSEPHLHFQLQDSPVFEMSTGLPVEFAGVAAESPWRDESEKSPEMNDEGRAAESRARLTDGGEDRHQRTAITAGQRVRQQPLDDSDSETLDVPGRTLFGALERLGLGFAVGVLLAVFGGFVFGQPALSAGIAGCGLASAGSWALLRGRRSARPGGLGFPVGLVAAAALWWVGSPVSAVALVIVSGVGYALVAEIDRFRGRRGFEHGTPQTD